LATEREAKKLGQTNEIGCCFARRRTPPNEANSQREVNLRAKTTARINFQPASQRASEQALPISPFHAGDINMQSADAAAAAGAAGKISNATQRFHFTEFSN
jgi:hypothetical protein